LQLVTFVHVAWHATAALQFCCVDASDSERETAEREVHAR
jgi:hypothetical protein